MISMLDNKTNTQMSLKTLVLTDFFIRHHPLTRGGAADRHMQTSLNGSQLTSNHFLARLDTSQAGKKLS